MYATSELYKSAVYAPSRATKAKVTFDISDTTIANDTVTTAVTSEFAVSNRLQLTDKVREVSFNVATWEDNRFKLDGSFSFADDTLANNKEVGWVSNVLCDAIGMFTTNQVLSFTFGTTHSSAGITLTFDVKNGEYATDFDVIAYNNSGTAIFTTNVTGNTAIQVQVLGQINLYKRIDVVIKKWSRGNRRARVTEVDFGIVKTYTDANLLSLNVLEEMDIMTATLPNAEFRFTVDNSAREFNILNPTGFYKYLQQRQQIVAEIGVVLDKQIEWIPMGQYYLSEWTSDEGSLTASFTARTVLDFMSSFDYENLVAKTNYSLYQLAVDIFTLCGIRNYQIDIALQSVSTKALVEKANCKDVLQMMAIAGCANVFVDRNSTIQVKRLSPSANVTDRVDLDNMYDEPKIQLDKPIKAVEVTYFSDLSTSAIVSIKNVELGETLKLENNTLINTATQAQTIATWLLQQKNLRSLYSLNWRGNPAHELADRITIQNSYGTDMAAVITRNELTYQGYLSGRTEARGAVN